MILALSAGRDSPAELRARIALDEARARELLRTPRAGIGELAVLSTCHRTEIYVTADGAESDALHAAAGLLPGLLPTDQHDLRYMRGVEAVEHLFRVACGLDSLVIGETQVLGQVRRAYTVAKDEGAAGPVLANIFGRAIRLGKRVRAETPLGRLGRSIGSITSEFISAHLGGLGAKRGAVIGSGEAASDAAVALWKEGADLTIVGRSLPAARKLAAEVQGRARPIAELIEALAESEFAVAATSSGHLFKASEITPRTGAPLLLIDLSVPPAVEPAGRGDVDLRSLEEIPGPRGPEITDAVIEAEAMVRREIAELERWIDTRASGPAIRALRDHAEKLVGEEVARALGGMDVGPEDRQKITALGSRIANKLLHGPTTALRDADAEMRKLIHRLFGIDD